MFCSYNKRTLIQNDHLQLSVQLDKVFLEHIMSVREAEDNHVKVNMTGGDLHDPSFYIAGLLG